MSSFPLHADDTDALLPALLALLLGGCTVVLVGPGGAVSTRLPVLKGWHLAALGTHPGSDTVLTPDPLALCHKFGTGSTVVFVGHALIVVALGAETKTMLCGSDTQIVGAFPYIVCLGAGWALALTGSGGD